MALPSDLLDIRTPRLAPPSPLPLLPLHISSFAFLAFAFPLQNLEREMLDSADREENDDLEREHAVALLHLSMLDVCDSIESLGSAFLAQTLCPLFFGCRHPLAFKPCFC